MHGIGFEVIARILIGFTFFFAGLANIYYRENKKSVIAERYPFPSFILAVGVIIQVIAGISIMLNYEMHYALVTLIVFTILANIIFHDFWNAEGENFRLKLQGFNSSLAILGGLILLLVMAL